MKNLFFFAFFLLLLLLISCSNFRTTATAETVSIQPRSEWNAAPAKVYAKHIPIRITIHHEGTKLGATDDAAKKIQAIQSWGMGPDKNWADIPYHFLIAPNGTIYEGRNPLTVGETSTEYNPEGHLLICCLGNLEVQPLPKEQLKSLIQLTAYASDYYNISPDSIASHRDYSSQTTCPGKHLYPYIENGYIKKEVKRMVR